METSIRQAAFPAFVAGALMLLVGLGFGLVGISDSPIYNHSVAGFNWVMRVGGFALLAVGVLCLLDWPPALLLDAVVSGLSGVGMIAAGTVWVAYGDWLQGALVFIFGAMFVHAAWRNATLFAAPPARGQGKPDDEPAPPRPADLTGRLLRRRDPSEQPAATPQPPPRVPALKPHDPPPEGFLADLGRDDE